MHYWLYCRSFGCFLFNSYSEMMQNAILAVLPLLWLFLIQFLFKINAKCFLDCIAAPLFNSYSELMQNVFLAVLPLLWLFLIRFLFENDAKCSIGCIAAPVVVSYSILIQNKCKVLCWLYCAFVVVLIQIFMQN